LIDRYARSQFQEENFMLKKLFIFSCYKRSCYHSRSYPTTGTLDKTSFLAVENKGVKKNHIFLRANSLSFNELSIQDKTHIFVWDIFSLFDMQWQVTIELFTHAIACAICMEIADEI
jgi:hypothetical protein